jgi:hypothetical protein
MDNCATVYNPGQEDLDADGFGDDCEPSALEDNIEPTASGLVSPPANASGWSNADVTIDLSASDDPNGSGVKEIDYVLRGAQSVPEQVSAGDAASIPVSAEGETSIKFLAVDNAGNAGMPHTTTVRLDKTAPTIAASVAPAANASGWNNSSVTVSYACSDSGSGLSSCDAPAVISTEGSGQSATGTATDLAGNAAQATLSGINIDTTPPGVTCNVTPSVLWPAKHKMIAVAATVNVTDALSGPSGFVLTSVVSSEADTGVFKKDKPGDIVGFSVGTASTSGQIRAERKAKGPGRVYTFTWEGTDLAGNTASCSATVTVPLKKPRR